MIAHLLFAAANAVSSKSGAKSSSKTTITLGTPVEVAPVLAAQEAPVVLRSCTEGYTLDADGVTCISQIFKDPLWRCPGSGNVDMSTKTCACYVDASFSCPTGYTYDHKVHGCSKAELTPMIPSCAHVPKSELSDDGTQCLFSKSVEPRLSCQKGAKIKDGNCHEFIINDEALLTTCPNGWVLEGDDCILTDTVPCRVVEPVVKGQAVNFTPCVKDCKPEHHKYKNRALSESHDHVAAAEDICQAKECKMKVEHIPKCTDCHEGLLAAQGVPEALCERVTHMEPKYDCSTGHLTSKKCRVEVVMPAIIDCPPNTLKWQGGCFQDKMLVSKYLCPDGYKVTCGHNKGVSTHVGRAAPDHCECVKVDSVECQAYCPDDTWEPEGKRCIRHEPALMYCPDVGFSVVDDRCVGLDREPARMEVEVTVVGQEVPDPETCPTCKKTHFIQKVRNTQVKSVHGKNKTTCHATKCVDEDGVVYPPLDLVPTANPDPSVFPPLSTLAPELTAPVVDGVEVEPLITTTIPPVTMPSFTVAVTAPPASATTVGTIEVTGIIYKR